MSVFAWAAEQERARLIERTRAGIDRARRQGKAIGRPRASAIMLHAADLVAAGTPVRAAARAKGVREATLRRFLAALRVVVAAREASGQGVDV